MSDTQPFQALATFPLAWRWLEYSPALPEKTLQHIKPFTAEKADELFEHAKRFQGQNYWQDFQEVAEREVIVRNNEQEQHDIKTWLNALLPKPEQTIIISWTQSQALSCPQTLFCDYWDSFCYPVEDVVIWPEDERWLLLFDYKQNFYFARRTHSST